VTDSPRGSKTLVTVSRNDKENTMRFMTRMRTAVLVCGIMAIGAGGVAAAPTADHAHAHPSEGPHHGSLIELGKEDYHAELVHDEKTDTVTIYILDGAAAKAVPIPARQVTLNLRVTGKPQQFTLPAARQEGDPEGSASAFTAASKPLGQALHAHGATGRLNVEIKGKVFVGKVGGHTHPHPHDHVPSAAAPGR
jgi:hypothetical protein